MLTDLLGDCTDIQLGNTCRMFVQFSEVRSHTWQIHRQQLVQTTIAVLRVIPGRDACGAVPTPHAKKLEAFRVTVVLRHVITALPCLVLFPALL